MNRALTTTLILAASTSVALAQLGNATITWEADDGRGWTNTRLETTSPSVQVRMRVAWEAVAGFMFAGVQFDTVISGPAVAADVVTDPRRPGFFGSGSSQTLVGTRFGDTIKIDDVRDTLPAGLGPRGVFPGQFPDFLGGPYDRSNPAAVFTFRLDFDNIPGTRTVNSLYLATGGGDTISRYLRIYTSGGGAQNTPNTTTLPLDIIFIPTPGTTACAAATLLLTRRRR
jgi:hypothetical protein